MCAAAEAAIMEAGVHSSSFFASEQLLPGQQRPAQARWACMLR